MEKNELLKMFLDDFDEPSFFFKDCHKCENNNTVHHYLIQISELSIVEIIKYIIRKNENQLVLKAKDIVQFSDFNNSTLNLCKHLKYSGNKGYTFEEAGAYLLDRNRKMLALKKYGENQSKTAESIGLVKITETRPRKIFISYVGSEILNFDNNLKKKILVRLLFRIKLIQHIIRKASTEKIIVSDIISFLSPSTVTRRMTSIRTILDYIKKNSEVNLDFIYSDIEY